MEVVPVPFAAGAMLSLLPGELARNFGSADYDIRHNLTASYTYELPVHASRPWLAALITGWQISETFFGTRVCRWSKRVT